MSFLSDAREAKAHQRAAILRALGGIAEPTPGVGEEKPAPATGFDGGARATPEVVESHAQWLSAILRERSADAGGDFGS